MKIQVEKILYGDLAKEITFGPPSPNDIQKVEILKNGITFCCKGMEEVWNGSDQFIGFGPYEYGGNEPYEVCIYHCSPYPEGACWDEVPIHFCPFCGAKIEIEIVSTVRLKHTGKKRKVISSYEEVYEKESVE